MSLRHVDPCSWCKWGKGPFPYPKQNAPEKRAQPSPPFLICLAALEKKTSLPQTSDTRGEHSGRKILHSTEGQVQAGKGKSLALISRVLHWRLKGCPTQHCHPITNMQGIFYGSGASVLSSPSNTILQISLPLASETQLTKAVCNMAYMMSIV